MYFMSDNFQSPGCSQWRMAFWRPEHPRSSSEKKHAVHEIGLCCCRDNRDTVVRVQYYSPQHLAYRRPVFCHAPRLFWPDYTVFSVGGGQLSAGISTQDREESPKKSTRTNMTRQNNYSTVHHPQRHASGRQLQISCCLSVNS